MKVLKMCIVFSALAAGQALHHSCEDQVYFRDNSTSVTNDTDLMAFRGRVQNHYDGRCGEKGEVQRLRGIRAERLKCHAGRACAVADLLCDKVIIFKFV